MTIHNIQSRQIRFRLDEALKILNSADVTKTSKLKELWAIMSDIELWLEDAEIRLRALESK